MRDLIRSKMVALAFGLLARRTRARRRLALLFRPRVRAIDHVTLPVHDLALARKFYCDVLGAGHFMTVDDAMLARFGRPPAPNGGEMAHHVSVYLGGSTRVELFLQRGGQPPPRYGHPHMAFRVTPRTFKTWQAKLDEVGIPYEGPLRIGIPGQASLYFNDPSGNRLEILCLGYGTAVPERAPIPERLVWDAEKVLR